MIATHNRLKAIGEQKLRVNARSGIGDKDAWVHDERLVRESHLDLNDLAYSARLQEWGPLKVCRQSWCFKYLKASSL